MKTTWTLWTSISLALCVNRTIHKLKTIFYYSIVNNKNERGLWNTLLTFIQINIRICWALFGFIQKNWWAFRRNGRLRRGILGFSYTFHRKKLLDLNNLKWSEGREECAKVGGMLRYGSFWLLPSTVEGIVCFSYAVYIFCYHHKSSKS